ncbi:MAG TPA: hypothetical protein PKA63_09190 [Oligoflexia bacterium]|nr:hypothetical protein [Oligoflexia bacterium]HMP48827.1 hypothetical protein [Oligoflexia bacterium]
MSIDFQTAITLSVTVIISLLIIMTLVDPFFKNEETLSTFDNLISAIDQTESKNRILDSLEELEFAKLGGLINDEEHLEQRRLILQDAEKQLKI